MCEEKKIPQEINDEDLESVSGGARDANGDWICKYCGNSIPNIVTNADCLNHYKACAVSPLYRR